MMNNKKIFIGWIVIIVILVIIIGIKYYPKKTEEKTSMPPIEKTEIEEDKYISDEKETIDQKRERILKEKAEDASYRYFQEQAEWAGIGEGED